MKTRTIVARLCAIGFCLGGSAPQPVHAIIADFSDLTLSPDSYSNNSSFSSNGAGFNNSYDSLFGSWGGFSYSNKTDTTTPGYLNQYSAITGTSAAGIAGGIYAVAYEDSFTPTTPRLTLPIGFAEPVSIALTNTTYTYLAIRDGDGFSNAFVEGDWFKVAISGYSDANAPIGSLDFYLADYRSPTPSVRYIVDSWTIVDLSAWGAGVSYLTFEFSSSDVGFFGINTPTYVAVGNIAAIPEPSTVSLLLLLTPAIFGCFVRNRSSRCKQRESQGVCHLDKERE